MPHRTTLAFSQGLRAQLRAFVRARQRPLALVGAVGLLLAVLIGWELHQSYVAARMAAQLASQHLSQLLKEQLDGSFREIDLVLRDLAGKAPAASLARLDQLSQEQRSALGELLNDRLPTLPQVDALALLSPDGRWMLSPEGVQPTRDEQRDYFRQLRDNPGLELVFSRPRKLRGSADLGFIIARRVDGENGALAGVAMAQVRLEYFNQLARRLETADNPDFENVFALLDNNLNVIGHYPELPEAIGKPVPLYEQLSEWVNGRASGYMVFDSPFDHVARGYQFYRLENFPFIVVVGTPEVGYFGNWRFKAAAYVAAFVLLMLFMLAMAWRSWREGRLELAVQAGEMRRLEQDEHITRLVRAISRPLMLVCAANRRILVANAAVSALTGYPPEQLAGRLMAMLFLRPEHEADILAHFEEHQVVTDYELKFRCANDDSRWVALSGSTIDFRDQIAYFISLADISERKLAQETLWQRATVDPLTGVANRGYFMERALGEWQRATRYGHRMALMMLDLDHFKAVNDNHGHDAGDAVLHGFAARIGDQMRETDLFGRLGGEEFALLMPEENQLQSMADVAERLRASIAGQPFELPDGRQLTVTVSIGCAFSGPGMRDFEQLLKQADQALYAAKHGGRNRVVCHEALGAKPQLMDE